MKYVDEFRNKNLISRIVDRIRKITPGDNINIMEVCGTHTQSFRRFGLGKLIPPSLKLIAGPGCPVCVSGQDYIDRAIALAKLKNTIILSFGDMLRVPGSNSNLERQRAQGADVRLVYSAWDTLRIARENPARKVIFLAVGFETTAPTIALSILSAKKENLKNLFFFSSLKLIPPAMAYLLKDKRLTLSGFLCPGHVSTIIGTKPYEFIPKRYKIGCSIAGFEPLDILEGIYLLMRQIVNDKPIVANQYLRAVTRDGNPRARKIISRVFRVSDIPWRGLGRIPQSGLKIKKEFFRFDAEKQFSIKSPTDKTDYARACRCGDILKGLIVPPDCPLFAKACSPDNAIGPCMVSSEGTCNAYYRYG
ncbi:MAG: hydrogenase formation protein HypD [Candidatus Omnitrophica bacterium]|nr:hydrogenase formation protein HypD [Candidatus Omnitrophota bacterium]MBU4472866.1 hydrogenase formation protein HypD [Candidatus Omnitrophota bacterium]MCG2706100.1 hydrogenase formation protein HypD [Candidatus Omnitrophota bacterium]